MAELSRVACSAALAVLLVLAPNAGAAGPRVTFRASQQQQGAVGFAFAFAGRFVVIADAGVGAHVYDAETGDLVRTIAVDGFTRLVSSQVLAVEDETVALAAPDAARVYLYDVATGALVRTLEVPSPGGYALAFADGHVLVGAPSYVGDSRVYLFDAASGALEATYLPPAPSFLRFGEKVRFSDGHVLCVSGTSSPGSDALFVFERDGSRALLGVVQAPGLGFDGHPSGFALVGDDLVLTIAGNDLPDEGPIRPSRLEVRDVHTGEARWRRRGPGFDLGVAVAAAGDDTILASDIPEVGPARVFQLDRRTGRTLRTIDSPARHSELGLGIVADATRALIGATDRAGFVLHLYDLSPCGAAGCADGLAVTARGAPSRAPRVQVACPPVPGGGICTAVGLAEVDGPVLTRRVKRAAGGDTAVLLLSLNRMGRFLFNQANRFMMQVAVTIRNRDGRVATYLRAVDLPK